MSRQIKEAPLEIRAVHVFFFFFFLRALLQYDLPFCIYATIKFSIIGHVIIEMRAF